LFHQSGEVGGGGGVCPEAEAGVRLGTQLAVQAYALRAKNTWRKGWIAPLRPALLRRICWWDGVCFEGSEWIEGVWNFRR
jgi:hypothetical protein